MSAPKVAPAAVPTATGVPIAVPAFWSDGLCSCCNDPVILGMGWCFPCVTTGQLYERVVQKGTCMIITAVLAVIMVTGFVLQALFHPDIEGYTSNQAAYDLSGFLSFCTFLAFGFFTYTVRAKVRKAGGIQPTCCGPCDDCCCGFFCPCLSQTQILRHLGVIDSTKYSPTTSDGIAV